MRPSLTHITFAVSSFDRAINFYTNYCGLKVIRDRRSEGGKTVWLGYQEKSIDPIFVFVIYEDSTISPLDHLGFQVKNREDIDAITERAKAANILHYGPEDAGGSVGYFVMLKDPDGHIVEFTHGQPIVGI